MSKQTAVDLFHDVIIDLLRNESVDSNKVAILWIQCKAMEREQIEDAFDAARFFISKAWDGEDYFTKTYGKEAGHE